jgi:hypothetical protein
MAEGVVAGLEPVEVEQQQRRVGRAGVLQPLFQVGLEPAPVEGPGEGVGQGGGDQQHQPYGDDRDRPAAHLVHGADRDRGGGDHVPAVGVPRTRLQPLPADRVALDQPLALGRAGLDDRAEPVVAGGPEGSPDRLGSAAVQHDPAAGKAGEVLERRVLAVSRSIGRARET